MTADPILSSARYVVRESLAELRKTVEGVPVEALNWRPAGDDSNSLAVLATHTLHSTRSWLSIALGAPLPERDRPSEFTVSAADPDALLALVNGMSGDCNRLLEAASEVDWSAQRTTHVRSSSGTAEEAPAAFALLHAIAHLREHVGQMLLTRQLWQQRTS